MLTPNFKETSWTCPVRQVFKVSGVGSVGGCYVTDGRSHVPAKCASCVTALSYMKVKLASLKRLKTMSAKLPQHSAVSASKNSMTSKKTM
jgi:translation initiation factor IF-2